MKRNDAQLGKPGVLYKDTKTNIEALTGLAEGSVAYATDTNEQGSYNGATWDWGGGSFDLADAIHSATADSTFHDDDEFAKSDSQDSWALKKFTWANIKSALSAIYAAIVHSHTASEVSTLIEEITLTSNTTITFSSIPSGYKSLKIIFALRSNKNAISDRAGIQFNGDTGTNYYSNANAVQAGAGTWNIIEGLNDTDIDAFNIVGNTAPTGSFGMGEINILFYSSDIMVKQAYGYGFAHRNTVGSTNQNLFWNGGGVWNSGSPITSIKLLPSNGGTAFVSGSVAELYGIK